MYDLIYSLTIILFVTTLAILLCSAVQLHNCCRQIDKVSCTIDKKLKDYDKYLDNLSDDIRDFMQGTNEDERQSVVLTDHINNLKSSISDLEDSYAALQNDNHNLIRSNDELIRSTARLADKSKDLREQIQDDEKLLFELQNRVDSLTDIKAGLENAIGELDLEEIPFLSNPLYSLCITSSIQDRLHARGYVYVGELISCSEQFISEICGVGPVTIERIKKKLAENGLSLGIRTIRVNDKWFRSKCNQ